VSDDLFDGDDFAARQFDEAEAVRRRGDWRREFDLRRSPLLRRMRRRAPMTPGDRANVERLADLAVMFGWHQGAADLLKGLALGNERDGYVFAADYLRVKCAHAAMGLEQVDEALAFLQSLEKRVGPLTAVPWKGEQLPDWESKCAWPGGRGPTPDRALFFSRLYHALGRWLASRGQYGHAAVLLERGAFHARNPSPAGAQHALKPLRLALAGVLLEQGRLADCDAVLTPLAGTIDPVTEPGWHVQWLELDAHRHLLRGEYGPALANLVRVNDACFQGGFTRAALGALLNQAEVLILVNQVALAEELLQEASPLADVLEDDAARANIAWLARLADARARAPAPDASVTPVFELWYGRDSTGPRPEEGPPPEPPRPFNYLAFFNQQALALQWELSRHDLPRARARLKEMDQRFGDGTSPLIAMRLHALRAIVAYAEGDHAAAAEMIEEVCPHFEERGLRPDHWQAVRLRGWCAVKLGRPAAELADLAGRAQELVSDMADTLPPAERAVYLLNKWTVEEKALAAEIDRLERLKEDADAAPWYARPWRRWRLWRRLHAFLYRLDDNRRRLAERTATGSDSPSAGAAPAPLWRWLWRQRRDTATLSFLVLPDRTFVARSGWLSLDFAVPRLTRVRVREAVKAWHQLAWAWYDPEAPTDVPAEKFAAAGGHLADELGLPRFLAALPRRVTRLTVVADDALHGFPFAALPGGGGFLAEKYALTHSHDRSVPPRPGPEPPRSALVLGVSFGSDSLRPLMEVGAEVKGVSETLKARGAGVCLLLDDDAVRDRVIAELQQAEFFHAACHGDFRPDRPDASGLVLDPRPDPPEVLSLRELAGMDLARLRHVTLSSCWGADSFVLPGRWIVSLPETLCRRGAASVLASLWPVYDEVGRAFALRFNKYLGEHPRDLALKMTQADCRHNRLDDAGRRTDHPCYWAGYVLHGDAGPIYRSAASVRKP
jgi:hypothetical protein